MHLAKPVGREASARKYDLLSALMAYALAQDKHCQRQVLRIMALITTRYNWKRDELTMGQDEIARLWSVDARTVKREMARLRSRGWLVLKRQGARGRVSAYGIDFERMMEDTRPSWDAIGPDFAARITDRDTLQQPSAMDMDNVVPLRKVPPPAAGGTLWSLARTALHAADPAVYGAWYAPLEEVAMEEGCLILLAPSRFHATYVQTHYGARLDAAVRALDPSVRQVRLEA